MSHIRYLRHRIRWARETFHAFRGEPWRERIGAVLMSWRERTALANDRYLWG